MNRVEGVLNKIDWVIGILSNVLVAFAVLYLIGMVLVITGYIFLRELFLWQILFVEEYSAYGVVFTVYFAAAYTLRSEGHINVNILIRYLPHRVREGFLVFASLFALAMLTFMMMRSVAWYRYAYVRQIISEFPSNTPLWIPYLIIPIGLGVFGLAIVLFTVRRVIALIKGVPEEVKVVRAL